MRGALRVAFVLVLLALATAGAASAQGTVADYQRAMGLREAWQGLAVGVPDTPTWVARTNRFWFRRSAKGGNEFVLVDPDTKSIAAPFDHARLADSDGELLALPAGLASVLVLLRLHAPVEARR